MSDHEVRSRSRVGEPDKLASSSGAENQFNRRLKELENSPEYQAYLDVRREVFRLKDLEQPLRTGVNLPSQYWRADLALFDYMLDASPLIIKKLRHHCHHITGLRAQDYRPSRDAARRNISEKLEALVNLAGRDLLVPESDALGGFGFEIGGALFNIDTLKFFEGLVALRRGEILPIFENGERRLVVEIGAGWGGFAYQFKSLFPNTTYVIVDFPELFMFSAVYLKVLFPEARIAFYGNDARPFSAWWGEVDFVFIPNTMFESLDTPTIDLGINMVSFQEMTSSQVEAYVKGLHDRNCKYLYSLNRNRSPHNPELSNASSIIAKYFWPHEIEVLPVAYTSSLSANPRKKKPQKHEFPYRHIIGWRRIQL